MTTITSSMAARRDSVRARRARFAGIACALARGTESFPSALSVGCAAGAECAQRGAQPKSKGDRECDGQGTGPARGAHGASFDSGRAPRCARCPHAARPTLRTNGENSFAPCRTPPTAAVVRTRSTFETDAGDSCARSSPPSAGRAVPAQLLPARQRRARSQARFAGLASVLAAALAAGCGGTPAGQDAAPGDSAAAADATPDAPPSPPPVPVLGNGTHSLDRVTLREIGNATTDGLDVPRDLAFHPDHPEQLWVVNYGDTSVIQFFNPGTPQKTSRRRASDGGEHFLAHPAALAFGAPGFLATAPDENQITQVETPASFMGPTLWTSDPDVFDGGHDSHLDMLHNSPSAQGIAWERDNVYWVVDGAHRSLTRYDFHQPHELGGTDHSDGEVQRYVQGEVGYVPHVSSHIEYDAASGLVYLADTGNARIAVLDPRPGTRGAAIVPNYDGDVQYRMDNTELRTLVDGAGPAGLRKPSGLALVDGTLYVTDNETSRVLAFDAATGTLRDWIDLSGTVATGGLMGVAMSPAGTLYLTDAVGNRVLELAAR